MPDFEDQRSSSTALTTSRNKAGSQTTATPLFTMYSSPNSSSEHLSNSLKRGCVRSVRLMKYLTLSSLRTPTCTVRYSVDFPNGVFSRTAGFLDRFLDPHSNLLEGQYADKGELGNPPELDMSDELQSSWVLSLREDSSDDNLEQCCIPLRDTEEDQMELLPGLIFSSSLLLAAAPEPCFLLRMKARIVSPIPKPRHKSISPAMASVPSEQ
ncbi:hypothetical protein MARPO_0002s0084 [Marchantia polymorpha]|uniref:Uncharacterized protein n=1 Tax=Marchantia polymorpha TaxID=3197 RepID=A0A2R6XU16_MARPO|nr:hypothetical protein MARPO_0002s0084 [Marchantia polymorpha]|eukprot:PTQ49587.1 hypothetical protein MARPO_0002s0084 [Marchantia polymorpha]